MKKLLITLLTIVTTSFAATVHYDQKSSTDKPVVKYDTVKAMNGTINKPNHPNNKLYQK